MAKDLSDFAKERNEALFSLDKEQIIALCKKRGLSIPKDEIVFWAGIHKAILQLTAASEEQKEGSRQWLREHGIKETIG